MRIRPLWFVLALALVAALVAATAASARDARGPQVDVLTRNVYVGFDVSTVLGAPTPGEFIARATAGWLAVQASLPATRAEAWADEIAVTRPHAVTLQEAFLFRTDVPADGPATPAETVAYDAVRLLLDALERRGLHYVAASTFEGADVEVPTALGHDVRLTDREVVLVRVRPRGQGVKVRAGASGAFAHNLVVGSPLGRLTLTRGWASVDLERRGVVFRLVGTHLEPFATPIQVAQATELLLGPALTRRPVVLAGDFNSGPGRPTPTYSLLLAAGFADVGAAAGPTCCHASDLRNPTPAFTQRIDLVLERGRLQGAGAQVVGDEQEVRDALGLWPSDHGGVAATLRVRKDD